MDVEEIYADAKLLGCKHAGHGQCVTTIVARACKHNDRRTFCPLLHDGSGECFGRPFHEINGFYGLVVDGIFVKLLNLSRGKYLHNIAKIVKENGENLYRNCFLYRLYIFLRLVIYSLKPFYYFCIELTNIAS